MRHPPGTESRARRTEPVRNEQAVLPMAALSYEQRRDFRAFGQRMTAWLTVVGIGEDGWDGLGAAARQAIADARVLVGGERHLALVADRPDQQRRPWPRPFDAGCVLAWRGTPVCVLASGDPMLFGAGAVLARLVPAAEMRVLPAPSASALAAARLGWPLQDVALLSVTGRPV